MYATDEFTLLSKEGFLSWCDFPEIRLYAMTVSMIGSIREFGCSFGKVGTVSVASIMLRGESGAFSIMRLSRWGCRWGVTWLTK